MTTEITIRSSKELDIIHDITNHKQYINNSLYAIEIHERNKLLYEQENKYNNLLIKVLSTTNNIPIEFDKNVRDQWCSLEKQNRDNTFLIEDCNHKLNSNISYIKSYKLALEECYKSLEIEKLNNRSISINDIKMILIENKNIINDSINFTYIKDSPYLTFVFTGLRCTPDRNPYFNILDKDFPLRDIEVNIGLENHRFFLKPFPLSERNLNPRSNSGFRIHPHVLGEDEPCLGDFLDSIVEAIDNREWDVMASVLQLFFEQSYDYDIAGNRWPRFMLKACDPHTNESYANYRKTSINNKVFYGKKYMDVKGRYIYEIPFVKNGTIELFEGTYRETENFIALYIH